MIEDILNLLRHNPYPGRGIIIGRSEDNTRSIAVYFIMGRSQNSRNRVFVRTEDGIKTKAYDPAAMSDPSLVIYHPVRLCYGSAIITNGDQTDTIHKYLTNGHDFRKALLTRQFEPDHPNYTPRISGIMKPDGGYCLSILKTLNGDPDSCCRYFFEYPTPLPGLGHFISTYKTDGDPLPSFEGEPIPVGLTVADGIGAYAKSIWGALNEENKVSLYAQETFLSTGESQNIIINKWELV